MKPVVFFRANYWWCSFLEDGYCIGSVCQGNTPQEAYNKWLSFCYGRAYEQSSIINKRISEKYERQQR